MLGRTERASTCWGVGSQGEPMCTRRLAHIYQDMFDKSTGIISVEQNTTKIGYMKSAYDNPRNQKPPNVEKTTSRSSTDKTVTAASNKVGESSKTNSSSEFHLILYSSQK